MFRGPSHHDQVCFTVGSRQVGEFYWAVMFLHKTVLENCSSQMSPRAQQAYLHLRDLIILEDLKAARDPGCDIIITWSGRSLISTIDRCCECCQLRHGETVCISTHFKTPESNIRADHIVSPPNADVQSATWTVTYCRPMHILPPLPKAQNHLFISDASAESHLSGLNVSGSLNTSGLRWRL